MRGSSRGAVHEGRSAFEAAAGQAGDMSSLAEELFAVSALIDDNATLRRALSDPSREGEDKRGLVERLLGGKVSSETLSVVGTLAAQRWSDERDLGDTVERFAVEAALAGAESSGRIDAVEDELFRFERLVAGNPDLRDALTNRHGDREGKAELVRTLLEGKASPETVRLARQAVLAPRGRRFDRVLETYLGYAASRREQLTAVVTSATPLTEEQAERLSAALQRIYSKPILLQQVVEEDVIGGIRVQVGDEVVDGTVLRRLDEARRHLAGG
ncbi:F0F1 ATP synthase subunit delta [Marihabitans asiaticum]|uniref:ATP synthase subunit delta n=1 Tax=Marihabitans asiaticum TaxID=415218 RepID=A0A560W8D4_9MICO|nr:F0F1 ATP synthase subunit delta [Marihabitans asiaticum]TWD13883.1 ATP synthase F1 subcomplex delta subunit [Marihabitans asiaticum]